MSDRPKRTRRYVLAERPATPTGPLDDSVLRYEDDVPVPRLEAGQVLVKVEWMSLDVATRGWMNDTRSYVAPAPLVSPVAQQGQDGRFHLRRSRGPLR
ncbi:hypothetical protein [Actinopolymorpha pittospori]